MNEKIDVNVFVYPTRVVIELDHETYKEFADSCLLLDESKTPGDHVKEMIQNRLEAYERARADAPMAVLAQLEREGDHG